MQLSRYEQETIINFNEEEATASVYTHNAAFLRKLEKLALEKPELCRLKNTSHGGKAVEYIIPKSWVKINAGWQLSESEKERRREALKKVRFASMTQQIYKDSDTDALQMGKDTSQDITLEREA